MRRREFITAVGATTALWPFAALSQSKPPIIGYLLPESASSQNQWTPAFLRRLRELGWVEGNTVKIEYRWGEGKVEHLDEFAAELVRLKVNVIVTAATPPTMAAKRATSVIPIVFAAAADPVGSGLVASLARPGGNLTGLSLQGIEAASKRVELLREVVPNLRRLAILIDRSNPAVMREGEQAQAAARAVGLEVVAQNVWEADDISPAFAELNGRADALYLTSSPLLFDNKLAIGKLALKARLPSVYGIREEMLAAGGLLSYGASINDLFRRAAELVDRILRGEKPAEIPVEPTKFDLVVNLKTAKELGLTVPHNLLVLADEVIE
jgi:putative tryptophan/tyrosine transport system substrate-binding protein